MASARAPVQQQSTPAAAPKSTQPSVNHAAQPTPQSLVGPPALRLSQSSASPSAGLPTEVSRAVSASNPGAPLPAPTQTTLQNSLQVDLSPVRVHSDRMAASAAASVQARAFTYGHHIYLGAGQHSSDSALMAHEAAHVIQQQNGAAIQTWSASGAANDDAFEAEARAAATAVERGQLASIQGRTGGQQVQRDALPQQASAPAPQAEEGGIVARVRGAIAGMVRSIPGYMLISFIIGRDVVANTPVERNAINLVGAVLGLIPGGSAMFENLQRSGALQRAFDWFNSEFVRLNFTWDYISGLFRRFVSTLGIFDIIPSRLLSRITETFGEPLRRLRDFAASAAMKVLEFIFEGVMGAGGAQILALLKRARSVFDMIVRDPLGFVNNLIRAVVGGFNQFKNNIVAHLQAGLIGWLTGALGGAGITLPPRFDLRGILSLVLQILGLTYQQIRPRLVRVLGESKMRLLEGAFEFLRILVTQGLAAAWQKIIEFAGNLTDMVLGGIRDFVVQTVVQQAIVRLIALFNPLGAIIQAIMGIYTTIQWFIQRIQQIMALVNSVLDSLANIASGNLTAAMNYVEQTMARALPVIISFLAGFVGLNRIADNVRDIIRRIQGVIGNAIDRVIDFVVQRVRAFTGPGGDQDPNERLQRGLADGVAAVNRLSGNRVGIALMRPVLAAIRLRYRMQTLEPVQRGNRWAVRGTINPEGEQITNKEAEDAAAATTSGSTDANLSISFTGGAEQHRLFVATAQGRPTIMLNPTPIPLATYLTTLAGRIAALPASEPLKPNLQALWTNADNLNKTLAPAVVAALAGQSRPGVSPSNMQAQLQRLVNALKELLDMTSHGIHHGTQSDPIPIVWYKATSRYPVVGLTINGQIRAFNSAQGGLIPVPPGFSTITEQSGGRVRIGLASNNQPENMMNTSKKLYKLQAGGSDVARGTGEVDIFRDLLEHYGYNWSGKAADHSHDLSFGGFDQINNLWPLSSTLNTAANQSYYQQVVLYVGTNIETKTVSQLAQKWFIIKHIQ